MKIGQILTKENYTQGAIWCSNNNADIKKQNGQYVIVAKTVPPEPTLKEQVSALESKYQMTRWQREGILAEGSLYSDYTKAKAQEIEVLASQLRTAEKNSVAEEVVVSETENITNVPKTENVEEGV